jgi:uncharacterized protein (TIGR02996 family)
MARSQADAFLEAILENPDDDTPRLIFADWLDERGDSASTIRAEFIRIQCVLAREHLSVRRRTALEQRQQGYLEENGREWTRPVRRLLHAWTFRRGFIDEVSVLADKFLSYAGRLFRQAPIRHVCLTRRIAPRSGQGLNMPELADSEHLRHLLSLNLRDNRLESGDVRAFVVSEHLTCLTSLNLSYNRIGDRGIRALAEAPLLAQLTHLDLSNNHFGAPALRVLAESLEELNSGPEGLRLRSLALGGNNLRAAGRRILLDSPLLKRLTRR